jgi:hypothetical protein
MGEITVRVFRLGGDVDVIYEVIFEVLVEFKLLERIEKDGR